MTGVFGRGKLETKRHKGEDHMKIAAGTQFIPPKAKYIWSHQKQEEVSKSSPLEISGVA